MEKLNQHGFEGNIRELRNIVERSYYLCEGNMITSRYFMEKSTKSDMKAVDDPSNKVLPLEIVEEKCIRNALKYCSGNAMKASELLKIGKATIYRKINKYGIDLNSYNKK